MTILQLETLAANAWPAAEMQRLGGWRLRFHNGVTRRANSVWPNLTPGEQALGDQVLEEQLMQVEQFYKQRNLPPRFQICPAMQPAHLDDVLAARGYQSVARTAVQVTELSTILTQTPPLQRRPEFKIEVAEEFDEPWFAAYTQFEEMPAHEIAGRRAILQAIQPLTGFALLRIGDTPAAVGLGVVEEGWLGIFCMATGPAFRRQGAATALLRTLTIWAQLYDAQQAYLQVMEQNGGAQAVYARAGFQTLYHYHYREQRQ